MPTFLSDVAYGFRVLRRNPGFAVAAVLSLALGLGAVIAIFSVVYGVLLRPLPYPEPDRIVQVWQLNDATGAHSQVSDPNFEEWRDGNRSFSGLAQYATAAVSATGGAEPARVRATWASAPFFEVLGIAPAMGRAFVGEELVEGGRPAVIVSDAFWRHYLDADPDIGARALTFDGQPHQVVGIMPEGFAFPAGTDLWAARERRPRNPYRTGHNWRVVGRLAPGVTLAQARAEMTAIGRAQKARYGDDISLTNIALVPLREQLTGPVRSPLLVLFGAVGVLLLVACANVANLTIAQLTARRRELAVRTALGASAWRLNRQLVTESLLLAAIGGGLGLLAAPWGVRALLMLDPARLPRREAVLIDLPVALFTLVAVAGVAVALALAAGSRAATGTNAALKAGGRAQAGGPREERMRGLLVAGQIALSLVLLVGAGLLGRTLFAVLSTDPGFRTTGALVVDFSVTQGSDPAARQHTADTYTRLMDRVSAMPGVTRVGGINQFPLSGGMSNGTFIVVRPGDRFESLDDLGPLFRDQSRTGYAEFRVASAGYFQAMGIPLQRGRLFDERDTSDAPHVALISASLARQRWPDQDPIGVVIQFGGMDGDVRPFTVVGIVGDVREAGLDRDASPTFYAHYRQRTRPIGHFSVVARTEAAAAVAPALREVVRDVRPDAAPRIRRIEDIVAGSFSDRRFNLWLLTAFGISAVVLAGLGIYGVTAFWVSRRTREIGIRLALGSTPGEVLRMVVGRTWRLVAVGAVAGVVAAYVASGVLRTMLFGVEPTDVLTFGVATALLGVVALAASVIPAARAARLDPAVALRQE
jgi:putative ABC transport system permease protein